MLKSLKMAWSLLQKTPLKSIPKYIAKPFLNNYNATIIILIPNYCLGIHYLYLLNIRVLIKNYQHISFLHTFIQSHTVPRYTEFNVKCLGKVTWNSRSPRWWRKSHGQLQNVRFPSVPTSTAAMNMMVVMVEAMAVSSMPMLPPMALPAVLFTFVSSVCTARRKLIIPLVLRQGGAAAGRGAGRRGCGGHRGRASRQRLLHRFLVRIHWCTFQYALNLSWDCPRMLRLRLMLVLRLLAAEDSGTNNAAVT